MKLKFNKAKPKLNKLYKCYRCGHIQDIFEHYCPNCLEKELKIRLIVLIEN